MHAVVRWYAMTETTTVEEIGAKIEEGFFPIIQSVPGFHAYYLLDLGDRTVGSISIFETREGLEESIRRAAEWVKANIAPTVQGSPQMLTGQVKASLTRE